MSKYTSYRFLTIISISTIDVRDDLFICYGGEYVFKYYGILFLYNFFMLIFTTCTGRISYLRYTIRSHILYPLNERYTAALSIFSTFWFEFISKTHKFITWIKPLDVIFNFQLLH